MLIYPQDRICRMHHEREFGLGRPIYLACDYQVSMPRDIVCRPVICYRWLLQVLRRPMPLLPPLLLSRSSTGSIGRFLLNTGPLDALGTMEQPFIATDRG
jgi:hypothetical protein